MQRFRFLTAFAALAFTAIGSEPKPARRSSPLPPVPAPAEGLSDTTPMKAESFTTQAPACTTQAPSCTALLPSTPPPAQAHSCTTKAPAQAPTCEARAPSCGLEAHVCDRCCDEPCTCRTGFVPGRFLVTKFLRRPVYGVQKAMNDVEARRLCRQECRLEAEETRGPRSADSRAGKSD